MMQFTGEKRWGLFYGTERNDGLRVSLFSPYFITLHAELRQKTVNQKGENKSAILNGDRTQDPSVIIQCSTDYATAASSLDSLLLYLINVTNEISCI